MLNRSAFTLIELLIVVAIIAILAAIAVPNFMEAQTRSKVSRCKADMRSLGTALEAYCTDYNHYPPCGYNRARMSWYKAADANGWIISWIDRLVPLTTPVSYITSAPNDPFSKGSALVAGAFPPYTAEHFSVFQYCEDYYITAPARVYVSPAGGPPYKGYVTYGNPGTDACWRLSSFGPDVVANFLDTNLNGLPAIAREGMEYDPTNGTISTGDIFRYGGTDCGNMNM